MIEWKERLVSSILTSSPSLLTIELLLYYHNIAPYQYGAGAIQIHQPIVTQEPTQLLNSELSIQINSKIKSATKDLKEEHMRGMRSLNE